MADPVLRHATAEDAEAVARLQVESWRAAYAGIIPAGHLAAMTAAERARRHEARLADPGPRAIELLAERAGAVHGWSSCGPARDEDLDPAATAEIYAIYADPAAWSTGVGSALMGASLSGLASAGFTAVVLWVLEDNIRARAFYERWEFAPDGGRKLLDLGRPVAEVRYRRQLEGYLQAEEARSPGPER